MLHYIALQLAREFNVAEVSVILERTPFDTAYADLLMHELQSNEVDASLGVMLSWLLSQGMVNLIS